MPIRAVLLDRDETLAFTDEGAYREAAVWAARRYGKDPQQVGAALRALWAERGDSWWGLRTLDDEKQFWAEYGAELGRRLGLPAGAIADHMAAWPYQRYLRPVDGARELLLELRARGLKVGVLSNTLPDIRPTLEAVGLDDLVDVALSSCALGVHKPDRQAFVLAAEALETPPDEVLFVDDLLENVQAARALGMRALHFDLHGREPGAIHRLSDVLGQLA